MVHLCCNGYSLKDTIYETIKNRKGDSVSLGYLNVSKTLQRDFWTYSDTDNTPEYCITLLSLLNAVFVGELVASRNYFHQVMHECVINLLNLEMDGTFTLTINRFLCQANNGLDKQIIKCYDKMSVLQEKYQHKKLPKQLISLKLLPPIAA